MSKGSKGKKEKNAKPRSIRYIEISRFRFILTYCCAKNIQKQAEQKTSLVIQGYTEKKKKKNRHPTFSSWFIASYHKDESFGRALSTKHRTKSLTHQTGNYPVTCFVSRPSGITSVNFDSLHSWVPQGGTLKPTKHFFNEKNYFFYSSRNLIILVCFSFWS